MIITPFSIAHGEAIIHGDIYHAGHTACPILLLIHGFQGSKNWGFFPAIAQAFAQSGYITISWNMSLNGYSKDAAFIDQPEDFARNTISQEILDTQIIIDSILCDNRILSDELRSQWNGTLHVLGHSRGGGIAIIISEKNPCINKLVLWNSISRFGRFTERQKRVWSETGIFPIGETEHGKVIAMNYSYIHDLEIHGDEYSPLRAIEHSTADILIVHAEQDMTVPLREGHALQQHSVSGQICIIPKTGHIFGCSHPYTGMTDPLQQAIDITTAFFSA